MSHIFTVVLLPVRVLGNRCATFEQETLSLAERAMATACVPSVDGALGILDDSGHVLECVSGASSLA